MPNPDDKYTDDNADDDFNSGFEKPDVTGPALVKVEGAEEEIKTGEGEAKTEVEDKPAGEDKPEGEDKTEAEDKPDEVVTLTKSQLDRLLAAADKVDGVDTRVEKLFGTTGDLKNIVKNLQEATPKGTKVKLSPAALKAMEEEYPDLAPRIKNLFEDVEGTGDEKPAGGTDDKVAEALKPEAIQKIVEDSVVRREMKDLEEEHPDWRKDVGLTDAKGTVDKKHPFRVWLSKQPDGYAEKVNKTDSPLVVSRALDKFKAFSAAQKPKAPVPPKKNLSREDRINDAVTERGDGGQPKPRQTADEAFNEGFKTG